jgi:hypothetical protein
VERRRRPRDGRVPLYSLLNGWYDAAVVRRMIAVVALLVGSAASAYADPTAEDLFRQGREAARRGAFAEACKLFAASQDIEPRTGTLLNLGDCLDHLDLTASAWEAFVAAHELATARRDAARAGEARRRSRALEPKLARLTIIVAAGHERKGMEVRRDGKVFDRKRWNVPVPIDPGEHTIEARAPGFVSWQSDQRIEPQQQLTLEISPLVAAPTPPDVAADAATPTPPPPPRRIGVSVGPSERDHRLGFGVLIGGDISHENPLFGGRFLAGLTLSGALLRGIGTLQFTRYHDEPMDDSKRTDTFTAAAAVEALWTPNRRIGIGGGIGLAMDYDVPNQQNADRQSDLGSSLSATATPIVARFSEGDIELGLRLHVLRAGDETLLQATVAVDWFAW